MQVYVLKAPIEFKRRTIARLTLRPPTLRDVQQVMHLREDRQVQRLVAILSGSPPSLADMLDSADLYALAEIIATYMEALAERVGAPHG